MIPTPDYPLAWARKRQFMIAGISLPFAIGALVDRHGSAETVLQLIMFMIAMCVSVGLLYINRGTGKPKYSSLEMMVDAAMVVQFLGIYIAGIVILARRHYTYYSSHAQGIPHTYSNLSCLIMFFFYAYTLAVTIYHRYLPLLLKLSSGTTYVVCPSCDQDSRALDGILPRWQANSPQRTANSFDETRGLYTDSATENQSLLRDEINEPTKQESGIISSAV